PDGALPPSVAINQPGQSAGVLGIEFDPLNINNPERGVDNLKSPRGIGVERIDRRLRLLQAQNSHFSETLGGTSREVLGYDRIMSDSVKFMRAEETAAFNLSEESDALRDAYGRSRFGQGCLMARRLVESGVRFVEVTLNGWDT